MAEVKYPQAKVRGITGSELVRISLGGEWFCGPDGLPLELPLAEAQRRIEKQDWNVSAKPDKEGK